MELKAYYGKMVHIITMDGTSFFGVVNDYFDAEDNEFGEASIIIDTPDGDAIEFPEGHIEKITGV